MSPCSMRLKLCLLFLTFLIYGSDCKVSSMIDFEEERHKRFRAFRFEVGYDVFVRIGTETVQVERYIQDVKALGDSLSCFGWVQNVQKKRKVVGEVRCFVEIVEFMSGIFEGGTLRYYRDRKIQYHFVGFQILDPGRRTCFTEVPHQCSQDELYAEYISPDIIWPKHMRPVEMY